MRELIVNAFVTLDGVMQAPGGPDEDPSAGFAHGGWAVTQWDDMTNQRMAETLARPFDLLLGRRTCEIFAAHWPHVHDTVRAERGGKASALDDPAAAALNRARKYVASRTLDRVAAPDTRRDTLRRILMRSDLERCLPLPLATGGRE
jgi:dihydrofolate reductase